MLLPSAHFGSFKMSIFLALGVPGAGKTLALQDRVHDATLAGWTCFVVDMAGEWRLTDAEGKPNPRWRNKPPPMEIAPNPAEEINDELLVEWRKSAKVILFGYPWEALDVARLSTRCGGVIYVDDEIDRVARYEGWLSNPLREMCHRGRHLPDGIDGTPREVHLWGAARRPQNLHTDVTELCDEMLIFRVQGSRTTKRLYDEGILTKAEAHAIRTFPNLHFYKWTSDGKVIRGYLESIKHAKD